MAKKPQVTVTGQNPVSAAAQDLPGVISHGVDEWGSLLGGLIHHLTGGGGHPAPAALTATTSEPARPSATQPDSTQSVQSLLSAILGNSQGQIPQGYANFFTQVLGPVQAQLASALSNQLSGVMGVSPSIPGMSPADRAAVNKAMGSTLGDLNTMNAAAMQASGPGAAGLQQFVLGPIANEQKQMTALQNALSYLPFATQTAGTMSPFAQQLLASMGIPVPGSTLPGAVAPTTAVAAGQAPVIP